MCGIVVESHNPSWLQLKQDLVHRAKLSRLGRNHCPKAFIKSFLICFSQNRCRLDKTLASDWITAEQLGAICLVLRGKLWAKFPCEVLKKLNPTGKDFGRIAPGGKTTRDASTCNCDQMVGRNNILKRVKCRIAIPVASHKKSRRHIYSFQVIASRRLSTIRPCAGIASRRFGARQH